MSNDRAKNAFSLRVETQAKQNDILLITALANICEDYGIEAPKALAYINKGLKEKIQIEAEDNKTIKADNLERPSLFI